MKIPGFQGLVVCLMAAAVQGVSAQAVEAGKEAAASGRHVRDGLVIDFSARAARGKALREGELAEVEFRISEEAGGAPVRSNVPAVWMDLSDLISARAGGEQKSCKEKIGLYLRGVVGMRPMLDLNSYQVMVMNQEASLSVIDPLVSMAGSTSTLASVKLEGRGMDWISHAPSKAIYVTMPATGKVAVVDTDTFQVKANVAAGTAPTRAALQPDGAYVWIGNNAPAGKAGGVTAIDTRTRQAAAAIATGRGHHEIAFAGDSRRAFVTNRDDGTVSVIDTQKLRKTKDLETGPAPIAIAHSALSGAVYVADAQAGTVAVIDAAAGKVTRRIAVGAGLGPMRFSPDGRYGFVLQPGEGKAFVIDASSDSVIHAIDVGPKPYQVVFTRAFAYVRGLASERVRMVSLGSLGRGKKPTVQSFAAGATAPELARDLVIADSLAPASTEAAMMVVNPSENATYFYMEGMNAPASSYKAMGARARAVMLVDRSMKEVAPGVYRSWVRPPSPGKYDVAVLLDSPRLMHCFSAEVEADPRLAAARKPTEIEFIAGAGPGRAGESRKVRFRLTEGETGKPRAGLGDVSVLSFLAPGRNRSERPAREVEAGVYEAELALEESGAYYVRAASPTAKFGYHDLAYITIRVSNGSTP